MGAKSLTYLSRSGNDKEDTQAFVSELESNDVEVLIVRGDVSKLDDVKRVVAATAKPIKGVVQAALTLQVMSHFMSSCCYYHAKICRQWIG